MTVTIIEWDGDDQMSPLRLMGDHAATQDTLCRCAANRTSMARNRDRRLSGMDEAPDGNEEER